MNNTPEREKFEKWFKDRYDPLVTSSVGSPMEEKWEAWQAALSTTPAPLDSGCGVTEEWELPTTPPEVEPVAEVYVVDGAVSVHGRKLVRLPHGTKLYTSPPYPKAEWDAEGNPLNLMAAAKDAYFVIKTEHGSNHPVCIFLRKLLKDPHG